MIAQTSESCIVAFTGDSVVLYSVISRLIMWLGYLLGKDAFITINFVLDPRILGLGSQGPSLRS